MTCSSDKIRLPLNVGNSSGVNVQPWPGSGGLFEGLSHRRTFSSRTHGRPTSMAFSQACLSSVLKKLVQEAVSLAAVRTSERRAISPRGSSSKVSQPRRGGEPPPRPEGRPLSPDGRGRPVNGRPSLRSSLLKEMHGSSHTERRPRAALCAVRGRLCVRACVVSGQAAPVQKRTRMAAAWARVAPPPGFRAAGPVPLMRPPA